MQRHGSIFILAAVMALVIPALVCAQSLTQAHNQAAETLWIAVDQAPLRFWRSAESEVVLRLPRGAEVRVLHPNGSWTRVREPGGQEGWVYQGHLTATAQPPALASLFDAAPKTMILAEAAETARSTRSQAQVKVEGCESLWAVLDMNLTPAGLDEFLSQGGIGEFSHVKPHSLGGKAIFPTLRAAAPLGGDAQRQLGLNLAASVVRRMASPTFGTALHRYVNLVGLAVARFAPGHPLPFRAVVLELPEPVSFSLPGGLVMVSTGLLAVLENEAQLALILAHETAHASLGHLWARALSSQFFRNGGKVDAEGVRTPLFAALLEDLRQTALVYGLDRNHEFEADVAAVHMAYQAGYDPQQLPRAIGLIEQAGGKTPRKDPPLVWAALHPSTKDRVMRLVALLAKLPVQDGLALATQRYLSSR